MGSDPVDTWHCWLFNQSVTHRDFATCLVTETCHETRSGSKKVKALVNA